MSLANPQSCLGGCGSHAILQWYKNEQQQESAQSSKHFNVSNKYNNFFLQVYLQFWRDYWLHGGKNF